MDALTLWMGVGFLLAAYSVIANDSVQTLGTWMASNNERFNYKTLWIAASAVLLATLWYGECKWWRHQLRKTKQNTMARSTVVSCCRTCNLSCID